MYVTNERMLTNKNVNVIDLERDSRRLFLAVIWAFRQSPFVDNSLV